MCSSDLVVTTYDENGGYPHPDHIRTHEVTMAAIEAAADPSYAPPVGIDVTVPAEPWRVLKVYYNKQFSKPRVLALHQAMLDAGEESPYVDWLTRWDDRDDAGDLTTRLSGTLIATEAGETTTRWKRSRCMPV